MAENLEAPSPIFIPLDMGSRVRISPVVLRELGWDVHKEDFVCQAVLRGPEELICAPEWLMVEGGNTHPLAKAFDIVERLESAPTVDVLAIPTLEVLAMRYRVARFQARWSPPKKIQLDINIGSELVGRLSNGAAPGRKNPRAFAAVYGGMLILASERYGTEVMKSSLSELL